MSTNCKAPIRVGIILTPNFTLSALANFVDVLRLSADEGDRSRPVRCKWHIMAENNGPIVSSSGVQIPPTNGLLPAGDLDYVAVVGGLLYRGHPIDKDVARYLRQVASKGVPLIGICTGTFILCRLGLMADRKCCVSWYHYRDFREEFADVIAVVEDLYVSDRDRLTTAGGIGAALLAAAVVAADLDRSVAEKALRIMQIEKSVSLQPFPVVDFSSNDKRVSRALSFMEQNLEQPVAIDIVARSLSTTRRSLERLFSREVGKSPKAAYMQLRLTHAHRKLTMGQSVSDAAKETGFSTANRLKSCYKKYIGRPLMSSAVSNRQAL